MKRPVLIIMTAFISILIVLAIPTKTLAQEGNPPEDVQPDLSVSTIYPSQVVEIGEIVTIKLNLKAVAESQTVQLEMDEVPDGWDASFRGGGRIVHSVFVEADTSQSVDLRLEPPANLEPGTYEFGVLAQAGRLRAELSIMLVVQEKVPASLSFEIDLPTIKGSPSTTFRYSPTLKNEGDQELMINLIADVPQGFLAKFKVSGQEVTSFPLGANQSKTINIELDPLVEIPAGNYPFTIYASGGDLQADLELNAEVTGQQNLSITGLDGRLSGKANAGKETTLQILVRNTGTAPSQGVEMSSSAPSGWTVSFDPEVIDEIPADEQVEVTAKIKPSEKAIAGDYIVTFKARPADGADESAEFRITVSTSTLWGMVGIALIAVAVGVVSLAVVRFGRR